MQVQKVIQGLEDNEDSQATSSTHCKLEPNLSISPKLETIEVIEVNVSYYLMNSSIE